MNDGSTVSLQGLVVPFTNVFPDISMDLFVTLEVTDWEGEGVRSELSKLQSNI